MSNLLENFLSKRAAMSPMERRGAARSDEAMEAIAEADEFRKDLDANVQTALSMGVPNDMILSHLKCALDTISFLNTLNDDQLLDYYNAIQGRGVPG
jgi:hypothetical protein